MDILCTFLPNPCTSVHTSGVPHHDLERETTRKAFAAAHLYYVQHRTMQAIAAEFQTSRSTVSRLLSYAREAGIVSIDLRNPDDALESLASDLRDAYGIRAVVVPTPDDLDQDERMRRVAVTAGHHLREFMEPNAVLGVAWGSTIAQVSRHLLPKPLHGVVVVQLNGSGNHHTSGLAYASEILGRLAHAFDGTVQQFPVPAFFDDPATKRAVWRERSTQRVLTLQERMNAVVFSVGAADAMSPSHVYAGGYLDDEEVEELRRADVVGDVATVFYRADGSSADLALNGRATGPSLALLRTVPLRLCVVADPGKAQSLQGALAADLVTHLVIDETTARRVLQSA